MLQVILNVCWFGFFFFKQKTAYEMRISDWSSDVCSSDLFGGEAGDGVFLGEIGDDDVRRHIVAAGDQFGELIEPVAAACDEDEVMAALRTRQREMRAEPGGCAGAERRGPNLVSVTQA